MGINFMKYHGCGNDFIIIAANENISYSNLAKSICHRQIGVGSDGLIIFEEPNKMIFYNADGSEGTMCGNGLRCLAQYMIDNKKIDKDNFIINTKAGLKEIKIINEEIQTNLGQPNYSGKIMKIAEEPGSFIDQEINGFFATAIYTGTAHLVIEVLDVLKINDDEAFQLCNYPLFLERINVNFFEKINDNEFYIRTFERGVGWTEACGTGAAAVYAYLLLKERCKDLVKIHLKYGILKVKVDDNGNIIVIGPARKIAEGKFL